MRKGLTTLFTGRNLIRVERVDSTNRYLGSMVKNSPAEGTLVVAGYQTAGKGQSGKYWHSEKDKNLLLTLFWKPTFIEGNRVLLISKAVALAIRDMLGDYGIETWVKYPNDIYRKDKKIAGILIENVLRGARVQYSIIGIGLNVNQVEFPADLPNPISMKNITSLDYDLDECLFMLCNRLEQRYLMMKAGDVFNELVFPES